MLPRCDPRASRHAAEDWEPVVRDGRQKRGWSPAWSQFLESKHFVGNDGELNVCWQKYFKFFLWFGIKNMDVLDMDKVDMDIEDMDMVTMDCVPCHIR